MKRSWLLLVAAAALAPGAALAQKQSWNSLDRQTRQTFERASGQQLLAYINAHPNVEFPTYKREEANTELRRQMTRANQVVSENQRLDKKWNNGYPSGDTQHSRTFQQNLQTQANQLIQGYERTMRDWNASPAQKERAQNEVKKLKGGWPYNTL